MRKAYQYILAGASTVTEWFILRQEQVFFIKSSGDPASYESVSGDGFAISQGENVRDVDVGLFPFGLPLCSVALEIAQELLFLTIDRNDRVALLFKLLALLFDVMKLRIAIKMRDSFNVLFIRTQGEPQVVEQRERGLIS